MSLLKAATADILVPINDQDAVSESLYPYTGGAFNNQATTTTATFATVAAGSAVTFAATSVAKLGVGMIVQVTDGTRIQYVQITGISGLNVTGIVLSGTAAAATMSTAATVRDATSATFVAVAVGVSVAVKFNAASQANKYLVGDVVTVTDGTTSITGTVLSNNQSGGLVLMTTAINSGSAGSTVALYAVATSTSGDAVAFALIPPYVIILGITVISDSVNAGVTISAGYVDTAFTELTHGADMIVAGTALATAVRVNTNAAIPFDVQTDKPSYAVIRVSGGPISATTNLSLSLRYKWPGNP